MGLILVIALLTLPAAIAGHHVHSLKRMMGVAVVLGALCVTVGLGLSFQLALPAGATIVLIAASVFFLSIGFRHRHIG